MMGYADEYDGRAREMEFAAAERRAGCSCSPFGRIISRAIMGGNGREGRRPKKETFDYAMAQQTYYMQPRPSARTVTITTGNSHHPATNAHVHAVPPEPTRSYAAVPGAVAHPQPQASGAGNPRRKKKKKKRVTFTPETASGMAPASTAPPPHAGGAYGPQRAGASSAAGGAAAGSAVYHHSGAAEPYTPAPPPMHGHGHGHAYGYGYGYGYSRYAPSPLTRREALGTPRRHEYFSGEYRWHYPTPVRESIYSFATDANHRLTAVFSEENPNACTIV